MEKIFINGMRFDLPAENAPDFVKGKISINVAEFTEFAEKNKTQTGWLNIDLKVSKSGKAYAELNTWKPEQSQNSPKTAPNSQDNAQNEVSIDDIDF